MSRFSHHLEDVNATDEGWLEACPHEPVCDSDRDCQSLQEEDAAIDVEDQHREEGYW